MLAPKVGGVRVKMTRQAEKAKAKKTLAKFMVDVSSESVLLMLKKLCD